MKKHLAVFASVVMLFTLIVGCTKASGPAKTSADNGAKTAASIPGKGPLDPVYKEYISGSKTAFFVPTDNGEHSFLKENHPLVQEVVAAVKGFSHDSSERDYRTDDGKNEYQWYAKEVVEQLLIKKDPEKTLANLKKYQVIQKELGTTVDGIMFSKTGNAAQAAFETKIRWESGTKAFLDQNKTSLNTDYKMQGVAVLIKENGRWKVQGVSFNKPQLSK